VHRFVTKVAAHVLYDSYPHPLSGFAIMLLQKLITGNAQLYRFRTQYGHTIPEMSQQHPVMVIFLRHFKCTFCQEAMQDLARYREAIISRGTHLCFVHLATDEKAEAFFSQYGLADLPRISNPSAELYHAFDLDHGNWIQLFGPKVILRFIHAGLIKGNMIGIPEEDSFQMPGIFLLEQSEITRTYRHTTAADRPDYVALACSESCD